MSAAAGVASTTVSRSWSLGPVKIQLFTVAFISGDTTATITGTGMTTAYFSLLTGVTQTAAATYSGAVATHTFTDPAATIFGQCFLVGV